MEKYREQCMKLMSNKCRGWNWNQNTVKTEGLRKKTKKNCQWRGLHQLFVHEVEKGISKGKCQMCQRPFQWDKNTQGLLSLERNIFYTVLNM